MTAANKFWKSLTPEQRVVIWSYEIWKDRGGKLSVSAGLNTAGYILDPQVLERVTSGNTSGCEQTISAIEKILERKNDATVSEVLVALKGAQNFYPEESIPPRFPLWLKPT